MRNAKYSMQNEKCGGGIGIEYFALTILVILLRDSVVRKSGQVACKVS